MSENNGSLEGKTCLVSGATSGIGRAIAMDLADRGAHVVLVGRNRQRGEATLAEISEKRGEGSGTFFESDLSSQAQIRRLAQDVLDRYPRLDVLVNNAGAVFNDRQLSADGIEMTCALNHLGYFLLTDQLMPGLRAAGAARIVNVASDAHRGVTLDLNDLQNQAGYNGIFAYRRSKLANIYFTYQLARRLDGSQITCNAMHPGFVSTDIGVNAGLSHAAWQQFLKSKGAVSAEAGAETAVFLASAPQLNGVTARYFVKCRAIQSSIFSYDFDIGQRLWRMSADLTGVAL